MAALPERSRGALPLILRQRDFRNLWLASLLSKAGSQVSRIGLILFLFQERGAVAEVALLVVCETLPGALVAPAAGAFIDRFGKRRVMVLADLARAVFMAAILISPTPAMIYAMAALHSVAAVFFEPARTAALPRLVAQRDLPRANGIEQTTFNLVLVAGPVLGAELLLTLGLTITLVVDVASFLLSAWLVTRLPALPPAEERTERPSPVDEIVDGWRYLRRHPIAARMTGLFFVSLLCVGLWIPLAPFFITDFLAAGERVLGWQMAVFGIGGIVGGLTAPRLVARLGQGTLLSYAFLAEGAHLLLYALVPSVVPSTLLVATWGMVVSWVMVPFYSILQGVIAEAYQGRVFAAVRQAENVALLFAMGVATAFSAAWAPQHLFLVAGVAYLGTALVSQLTAGGRRLMATP
ncbi:MAG: MFS transporter [Acidobacteriota bacterium]